MITIAPRVLKCFDACLCRGGFLAFWRRARLVLVPKPGRLGVMLSFRSLCLLDELGKLFERVLASRMEAYITQQEGLSPCQFRFRLGLSTCDAVAGVRAATKEYTRKGEVCVIVSLDVKNAFPHPLVAKCMVCVAGVGVLLVFAGGLGRLSV